MNERRTDGRTDMSSVMLSIIYTLFSVDSGNIKSYFHCAESPRNGQEIRSNNTDSDFLALYWNFKQIIAL